MKHKEKERYNEGNLSLLPGCTKLYFRVVDSTVFFYSTLCMETHVQNYRASGFPVWAGGFCSSLGQVKFLEKIFNEIQIKVKYTIMRCILGSGENDFQASTT